MNGTDDQQPHRGPTQPRPRSSREASGEGHAGGNNNNNSINNGGTQAPRQYPNSGHGHGHGQLGHGQQQQQQQQRRGHYQGDGGSYQAGNGGPPGHAPTSPPQPPPPAAPLPPPTEQGIVVSVKESFGFIKRLQPQSVIPPNATQLFFHLREVCGPEGLLPPKAGQQLGDVMEVGAEVEYAVAPVDARSGRPMAKAVRRLPPGATATEDVLPARCRGIVERELRGGQRRPEEAYGGRIAHSPPAAATATADAPLAPAYPPAPQELLPFTGSDVSDPSPRGGLKVGDVVDFSVAVARRGGDRRAVRVALVAAPPPRARPGEAASVESARDAPREGREGGTVDTVQDSYGFLKAAERKARLFFHFSALRGWAEADLAPGVDVSFVAIPDGRTGKLIAGEVRRLPPGTAALLALGPEHVFRGAVTSLADGATPGCITLSAPPTAALADGRAVGYTITQGEGEGGPPPPPDGGSVHFTLVIDRLDGRLTVGRLVAASSSSSSAPGIAPPRDVGTVKSTKANYGFLRCVTREADIFFHFSAVVGGEAVASALAVDDDVEFDVALDAKTGKPCAVGILPAAKGAAAAAAAAFVVSPVRLRGWVRERAVAPKGFTAGGLKPGVVQYEIAGEEKPATAAYMSEGGVGFKAGEVVDFCLATDLRTGGATVRSVQMAAAHPTGTVVSAKDNFGVLSYGDVVIHRGAAGADGSPGPLVATSAPLELAFHAPDVMDGPSGAEVRLRPGDEVTFALGMNAARTAHVARKIKRTKAAPRGEGEPEDEPSRPPPRLQRLDGEAAARVEPRIAKGPDGTRGFTLGRGKPMPPPPTTLVKKLDISAPEFVPGS